jgi:hypothetical protein
MKSVLLCGALLTAAASLPAQSPAMTATAAIGGRTIKIEYSAPSVRGRKIFGDGGLLSGDPGAPIWRAGANAATALHTDGDLAFAGLVVPKGDYTLFVNLADPGAWELIVNRQTGQSGLEYDASKDLGRVRMTMSRPPSLVEMLKYAIVDAGGGKGRIQLAWENHIASVPVAAVSVGVPLAPNWKK